MGKIKVFWQKYESKLILVIGLILVAGISFQAGYLRGQDRKEESIVFENAQNCPEIGARSSENIPAPQDTIFPEKTPPEASSGLKTDCQFVGSKNSTKYHLPTCSNAKRIKPENIVCFKSVQEALGRGYEPSKDCIK